MYSHTTAGKVKVIIKKARRAKSEVGKRSKSKQLDKIKRENGKPGKRSLKKIPLRALIRRINHCCQSNFRIILTVVLVHGKIFASVSAEVRQSEDSMPTKP